jgi:hypothetical protein
MMRVDTVDSFNELKIMSRLEAAVDDEDLPSELSTLAGEVLARVARIDALHTACTQQEARSP